MIFYNAPSHRQDRQDRQDSRDRPRTWRTLVLLGYNLALQSATCTRKEMFYLTTHSTHFMYGYTASDIWYRTIQIMRGNPLPPHGLEREIAQWVHPMKDRSDDPSHHERTLLPRSTMKDRSDEPSHHERTLFTLSYISLPTCTMPCT